jgi:hypothetical protein
VGPGHVQPLHPHRVAQGLQVVHVAQVHRRGAAMHAAQVGAHVLNVPALPRQGAVGRVSSCQWCGRARGAGEPPFVRFAARCSLQCPPNTSTTHHRVTRPPAAQTKPHAAVHTQLNSSYVFVGDVRTRVRVWAQGGCRAAGEHSGGTAGSPVTLHPTARFPPHPRLGSSSPAPCTCRSAHHQEKNITCFCKRDWVAGWEQAGGRAGGRAEGVLGVASWQPALNVVLAVGTPQSPHKAAARTRWTEPRGRLGYEHAAHAPPSSPCHLMVLHLPRDEGPPPSRGRYQGRRGLALLAGPIRCERCQRASRPPTHPRRRRHHGPGSDHGAPHAVSGW